MHTYIHTSMHPYSHTCIHAYLHTCMFAYMHTCMYIHIYVYIYIYIYVFIYVCIYLHTSIYIYMHIVIMHTHVYVCMHACIQVCMLACSHVNAQAWHEHNIGQGASPRKEHPARRAGLLLGHRLSGLYWCLRARFFRVVSDINQIFTVGAATIGFEKHHKLASSRQLWQQCLM